MPLVVFLEPGRVGEVRRGDMVFQIAELDGGKWKPRWMAHTGIAERTLLDFYLHQSAMVIHMGNFISKDVWSGGVAEEDARVDVCGAYPDMDDLTRDDIIDEARAYYEVEPSIFQRQNIRSCYWMGDPLPSGHPLFPRAQDVYGFSCSTFAHHCYSKIIGPIVDTAAMPFVTDAERLELEGILRRDRIQGGPFRRLHTSYLIFAFKEDRFPFNPEDWEPCKQYGTLIPTGEVAA